MLRGHRKVLFARRRRSKDEILHIRKADRRTAHAKDNTLDSAVPNMTTSSIDAPLWMRPPSPIQEDFPTRSSDLVEDTAEDCLPLLLRSTSGLPHLAKEKHIPYLKGILGKLPSGFAGLDASRPWLLYWSLLALSLMEYDVSTYRESYVEYLPLSVEHKPALTLTFVIGSLLP